VNRLQAVLLGVFAILVILTITSYPNVGLATIYVVVTFLIVVGMLVYLRWARAIRRGSETAFEDNEPVDSGTHRPD
jgi:hypothetical protein